MEGRFLAALGMTCWSVGVCSWLAAPLLPRAYPCVRFAPRPLSQSERGRWRFEVLRTAPPRATTRDRPYGVLVYATMSAKMGCSLALADACSGLSSDSNMGTSSSKSVFMSYSWPVS